MKFSPKCEAMQLALLSLAFPDYIKAMSLPGIEIHRVYDEYGPIRVFEEGSFRYLAFSEDSQQSAVDLSDPGKLVFHYIQAMLLCLLYVPAPKRVTLLGLGAGSLVQGFRSYDAQLEIDAVELRPQVKTIASAYFALPNDPLIDIHIGDAAAYMEQTHLCSDLILTDIYSDDGMNEIQLSSAFLENCFRSLSASGILVLNLWDQGKGTHPQAKQALGEVFDDNILACPVEDGNLIVFAFKGGLPQINARHLQPLAKRLSKKLAFPVSERLQAMKTL